MTTTHRDEVSNSLREFKRRRDALLHGDTAEMELHLRRFVQYCDGDSFILLALQLTLPQFGGHEKCPIN